MPLTLLGLDTRAQLLKFVTCDRLFELHPSAHECKLALRKDSIVSNVSLARTGLRLGLHTRLTVPFRRILPAANMPCYC